MKFSPPDETGDLYATKSKQSTQEPSAEQSPQERIVWFGSNTGILSDVDTLIHGTNDETDPDPQNSWKDEITQAPPYV